MPNISFFINADVGCLNGCCSYAQNWLANHYVRASNGGSNRACCTLLGRVTPRKVIETLAQIDIFFDAAYRSGN